MDTVRWRLIGALLLGVLTVSEWRWRTGAKGLPHADAPHEEHV